jgi:hypothetical protein
MEMSEEERFDSEETEDVEAHRRRAMANEEASDQKEEDESDDVEAHRRRA